MPESPFAEDEPIVSEAAKKGLTRAQAIEQGRLLGEDEADRRRETGSDRETRVARAMAYAAWDYDGRPSSGQPRAAVPFRPDFKPERK